MAYYNSGESPSSQQQELQAKSRKPKRKRVLNTKQRSEANVRERRRQGGMTESFAALHALVSTLVLARLIDSISKYCIEEEIEKHQLP